MPKIAVATCAYHPGFIANDDQPLLDALGDLGADASQQRWDDADLDWAAFDGVVVRTTWDYQERLEAFLAWIDRVDRSTTLLNPAEVMRRNVRKTYLRSLEAADVPIVPTAWVEDEASIRAAIGAIDGTQQVVLKPCIGAGASGLGRFDAADVPGIAEHVAAVRNLGPVLLQPFLASILDRGELSVVLLDGEVSHAVRKTPAEGEIRVQIEFGGTYTVVEPTPAEAEIARRAVGALSSGEDVAYARVDLVEPTPERPAVIEAELIEPELFLPLVPGGAARLAAIILDRCRA